MTSTNEIADAEIRSFWETEPNASKLNTEIYGISRLAMYASKKLEFGELILDAGCGSKPYEGYFQSNKYIGMDFRIANPESPPEVVADIRYLPLKDSSVDAILCIEVLEYIPEPEPVFKEFFRVLNPGGKLFIAVPQSAEVSEGREHEEASYPYDYFRFARCGISYLLKKVGFEEIFTEPRGGYFWYIGHRLRVLGIWAKERNKVIGLPFYFLFSILIPLLCFYLDKRLRNYQNIWRTMSRWTLGYDCYYIKPLNRITGGKYND